MKPTLHSKKSRSTSSLFVKWSGLFMFLFLISGGNANAQVIISQVYEGASNNKWIEVTNVGNTSVNLATPIQYKLAFWNVTSDTGNGLIIGNPTTTINLAGVLASGESYLMRNTSASLTVPHNPMLTANNNNASIAGFNGNDALAIITGTNTIIDAFGTGINNKDISYHRNLDVLLANSNFTVSEWTAKTLAEVAAATNTQTEYLGTHKYQSGKTSNVLAGNWNDPLTWTPTGVPFTTDNVTILGTHIVTMTSAVSRDSGTTTTVNVGGTLAVNDTYTDNGATTIAGTFQLNTNGFAIGNNFIYGSTGTLNFNKTGIYDVNNADAYWPISNGPINVNVLQGGTLGNVAGFKLNSANRTIAGKLSIMGTNPTTLGTVQLNNSTLTVDGTAEINNYSYFDNSPVFGNNATLIYNTTGVYKRGLEWINNGVGTIGITPGYPNNVQISNNTTLDYMNGVAETALSKAMEGNLTIDFGSSLFMDYGTVASGGPLVVKGNVVNNGTLGLGIGSGDDLKIGGNFTNTGTFNGNERAIFFVKNGTQTVSSTTALTIPYVVFEPVSGSTTVQLLNDVTISAPNTGNAISFNNVDDVLDINGKTLTIGTSGVANVISGDGSFKGSASSNLTLLGTGSIGTLNFTSNGQNLNNLTLNRSAGQIGLKLGSPVAINNALNLTNGIIDLDNKTMILGSAIANVSGVSSSNYIIADNTVGGVLRKKFADASEASVSFTFPIGDKISSENGSQYSPATVSFETTDFSNGSISLSVVDEKEMDSQATTDYISRYWAFTGTGITNATYNFSGTYLPSDINGTESASKSGRKRVSNSTWIEGANLIAGSNTVILTDLSSSTAGITNNIYHFTAGSPLANAEIDVTGNSNAIPNGSSSIEIENNTFIGTANANSNNPTNVFKSFVISNTGNGPLVISEISLSGENASQFTITPNSMNIASGDEQIFIVTFIPSSSGVKNAIVTISNNDLTDNESTYTFAIQGKSVDYIVCEAGLIGSLQTIAFQNFESPNPALHWPYTVTGSGSGTVAGGVAYADLDNLSTPVNVVEINRFLDAQSFQINNSQAILNFNFNTLPYEDVELNFKLAALSVSTGNGIDKTDIVKVYVSTDGLSFMEEIRFSGVNSDDNFTWGFAAIGEINKSYNNSLVEYTAVPGTNGISTIKLINLPNVPTLYIRIEAKNDKDNEIWAIDNVELKGKTATGIATKTWNGTAWSGDGLPPTSSQKAIIDGDLTLLDTTLEGCECQVNENKTLTAGNEDGTTPATINIQSNIIVNGTLDIKNNSSLVQHNDLATYTGVNLSMKRTTQDMYRYDYTYWSSPVGSDFTLNDLSPNTLANKYFKWNHSADTPIWQVIQNGNEAMEAGKGYIVRAPQSFDVEGASGAAAALYTANFIGKPNNGEVTIEVTGSSDAAVNKWNLIGNPYPSAIDADAFLNLNAPVVNPTLGGTLYFWTHNTSIGTVGSTYSYNPTDYAAWNTLGGTATYQSPSSETGGSGDGTINSTEPSGNIAAGQGFFVKGNASGDATFNNSMRIAGDNNQFFKSPTTVEKHRVWLNMKGTTKGFSQALVGYVTNATNGLDNRFDGETFGGNQVTFYSMLDTKALVIQGRALPFLDSDTVPLGYKSTITENISIGIDHFDGLFDNQNIYLEDTDLNIVHDLKDSDYTFAGVPGTFNTRFILRYQPEEVLANPTFEQELQSVIIRKNDAAVRVHSPYETINTIWIYDLMGRLIFEQKNCNTNTFETNQFPQVNQTLIVKVKLNNGGVVTGKL